MSYFEPKSCRACGGTNLKPVFDLGYQHLANEFVPAGHAKAGMFPLKVLYCEDCSLGQLSAVVDPEVLYRRHYPYRTSTSATMKAHFDTLLKDIQAEAGKYKSIMEIGSNDGELLDYWSRSGFKTLYGVEPAKNLAQISTDRGITTRNNFFSTQIAKSIEKQDIILARHCFCHMHDWRDFVNALEICSHKDTLVAIEVPYVMDFIDRVELDTVYHEHLSYLSVQAMIALLHGSAFALYKIIKYPIHGGAILLMLRHVDWHHEQHPSVNQFLAQEDVSETRWQDFSYKAHEKISALRAIVTGFVHSEQSVVGYGASAKSSVWCQACGFDKSYIKAIYDNTPEKIGMLSPSGIPIVDEKEFVNTDAENAVLFAWNFETECLAKNKAFTERGGKFIIPGKELEYA